MTIDVMKSPKFDHTNPKHWSNLARRFRRLAKLDSQGRSLGGRLGCAGICHAISELRNKDSQVYEETNPINKLIVTQRPVSFQKLFYWPFDVDGMMSRLQVGNIGNRSFLLTHGLAHAMISCSIP